jgi:hypothetical protein
MDIRVTAAIIGALSGALASLLVNELRDWFRVWRATKGIRLKPQGRAGSRVTARVTSKRMVHGAVAYITLHHDLEDVIAPPKHFSAFISLAHRKKLQEDRLCWSVAAPSRNPASADIFAGEWQLLDVADFGEDGDWIEIPSELGWSSSQTETDIKSQRAISSRVFLRGDKRYRGVIKIVSADTTARSFEIEINGADQAQPLMLSS